MSATRELPRLDRPDDQPGPEDACANCGAELQADQEWCLECGAGRTLIQPARDWRIAAAVIATVVILALIGFGVAMVNLSISASP